MANFRTLEDGSLEYPHRGYPPTELPGYSRDPGNPYRLIPDFIPCRHRMKTDQTLPCGKIRCTWFCTHKGVVVDQRVCEDCDVEPKI